MKIKYYSLNKILEKNAIYNIIFGERSNGKTYSVLDYALKDYIENDNQFAIIRRWEVDFKGKNGQAMFDGVINNSLVTKMSKGKFNTIVYYSQRWYLAFVDENGNKITQEETPFAYAFSLASDEHYKSTSFPKIKTILFDEFITRQYYLPDEFIKFQSIISTIIRLRDDVKIFMLGNTVNKYCPYFNEMGLTNIKTMKRGSVDLYTYGTSGLTVAVEYSDMESKNKLSNKYFAFDNPKLNMIKSGSWEVSIYPHLPVKYTKNNIIYTYFIVFDSEILQCEIVSIHDLTFTFIHRKTTPIKDTENSLIYQQEYNPKPNYKRKINKPMSILEKKIVDFYLKDKIFYQDNEVGEIVRNYLQWCKNS